jgi:DNA-binding response OmpR family regulator
MGAVSISFAMLGGRGETVASLSAALIPAWRAVASCPGSGQCVESGIQTMESGTDILVIEDDPFMRELVALSLREAGYRVLECSGPRAQHLRDTVTAKVIIVDLNEPKGGSMRTIGALRARFPSAAIVAVSGYFRAGPALADAAIQQFGVDLALAKPFGSDELVASVKALLKPLAND